MKILISNDRSPAHTYIRNGIAKSFSACGHEVILWDIHSKSVFDAFDEFKPDLFLGQTYNCTEAHIQVLSERPDLRVILRASDNGNISSSIDLKKYPILVTTEKEFDLIKRMRDRSGKPDFLHNHYMQYRFENTHTKWIEAGFEVRSLMSGADVFDFTNAQYDERLASDIAFVGGRLPLKSKSIETYLLPLCGPDSPYKIKIWGNQGWGHPNYLGFIQQPHTRNALFSAKICPNLSEQHATDFGYDVNERYWKLLSNKCFCIADYVEDAATLLPSIVHCETPEKFQCKVDNFLQEDKIEDIALAVMSGYDNVMESHTYFDRIASIFDWFNLQDEVQKVDKVFKNVKERMKL